MTDVSSAQLLLAWQNKQTAQRKPGLSFSAIGGCRRRAGYLMAGTPATNASASVQSAMGSAAHDWIALAAKEQCPDDLVEHEVEFAGIFGTLDRFHDGELIDSKTTSSRWLDKVKANGISRTWRYQTAGYAAGLIKQGYTVRTIRLDVLARDTGEEWQHTRPFDPTEVADAMAWVDFVRSSELDMLPRDYDPNGPMCQGCPFFQTCWDGAVPDRSPYSVLFVEDPDAAFWAKQLLDARRTKADAKELEDQARGALDALRPNEDGKSDPVDVGLSDFNLQWTVTHPQRLNSDLVRAEYAKVGARPPMNSSTEVRLAFVPKPKVTP
jgi:hypothetical protein